MTTKVCFRIHHTLYPSEKRELRTWNPTFDSKTRTDNLPFVYVFSIFFWICFVWAPYKTCSDCVSHHHLSFFVSNLGAVFNGLAHVTLWGQASYAQYSDHDIFVFFRVKCRCCFVWFSSCNPVRVSSFRPKKRPRLLTQKIEPRDFRHLTKKWGPTFYPLSTCSAFLYKFCFVWAPW